MTSWRATTKRASVLALTIALGASPADSEDSPVWYWFESCGAQAMIVDVLLDGGEVFREVFPLCARPRTFSKEREQRILRFWFTPERPIACLGYRDDDNVSPPGLKLEGNIWLAGSEQNAVILGFSVVGKRLIYMNTIHVAFLGRTESSEVAEGVVVRTSPVAQKGASEPQ